ncbi:MAG: hypothetical protein AAF392_01325, partial [Bacteroidota bacterium]
MSKVISRRRVFAQLYLSLSLLASCYSAHAQAVEENSYELAKQYKQGEAWSLYPFTIQVNPYHLGFIMPLTLLELINKNKLLWIKGVSADISLLYVGQTIWKHFDCYPRAGLVVNLSRLSSKGYITGGLLYLEPNYNHLTGWEIVPRLGIGVAHIKAPGNQTQTEEQEVPAVAAFRQGPSLYLTFSLLLKYRLTPKWHLHTGVNFDCLPSLNKKKSDKEEDSKDLTIYTASAGVSYTFNPSSYNYPRPQGPRKSRIDIAALNSFRKTNPDLAEEYGRYHRGDNKYYYVGGLHGQWSLQLGRNHALTLATEWIKDRATKKELEEVPRQADLKVSLLVGHEFLWGKLVFGQQLGVYAMNDTTIPPLRLFYTRLGVNYRFTDFLFIGVNLKKA